MEFPSSAAGQAIQLLLTYTIVCSLNASLKANIYVTKYHQFTILHQNLTHNVLILTLQVYISDSLTAINIWIWLIIWSWELFVNVNSQNLYKYLVQRSQLLALVRVPRCVRSRLVILGHHRARACGMIKDKQDHQCHRQQLDHTWTPHIKTIFISYPSQWESWCSSIFSLLFSMEILDSGLG